MARPWLGEHTKAWIPRHAFCLYLTSLKYEAQPRPGENDKRYRRHHPASPPTGQACRYFILKIPSNPFHALLRGTDYNSGATLIRAGMCVHIFFHRNLQFGEADGDAPV
jgi:hypothetical protein